MKGQELKILFNRDKAYLTPNKSMTLQQVGLSEYAQTKGFQSPAYWLVQVINYIETERRIFCKVLSYHTDYAELNYSPQLLLQLKEVDIVTFRTIDTSILRRVSQRLGF